MKSSIKDFFSFTKKELNGLIVFFILFLFVAFAPLIYSALQPPKAYNYKQFEKEIAEFRASAEIERANPGYSTNRRNEFKATDAKLKPEYFPFNPNGLSEDQWKRLGLSSRQIKVIKNFESKGGHFYKKEDLKKIYSVTPQDYARLEPFISIPLKEKKFMPTARSASDKRKNLVLIELNSADSSQLETLKGIGAAFASRIIKYRNRLGGFYKREQLLEVYGMDSSKYNGFKQQIEISLSDIQKLNINTVSFEQLKKHPYLTYKQMNAIIQYRKQHGSYHSIDDLRKIVILNGETIRKIAPYLIF